MKHILVLLLTFGCSYFLLPVVYAEEETPQQLLQIARQFQPPGSILIRPDKPISTQPIQQYDFNGDGQQELLVTFKILAAKQFSRPHYGAMVLEKQQNRWKKVWEISTEGVALEFSGLVDITDNDVQEYAFGVTAGAALGSKLQVFQWKDGSFKQIATIPYHEFFIVKDKGRTGLAVWKMYIGDSYIVDVQSWDGKKLAFNQELYSAYYPQIVDFYHKKLARMSTWFYWYCLADAQIKANQFTEAAASIQTGRTLAELFGLTDELQDFKQLHEQLKEKVNVTK